MSDTTVSMWLMFAPGVVGTVYYWERRQPIWAGYFTAMVVIALLFLVGVL